jgi:hypothetical protein
MSQARSPQGKGRVERLWGTLQDRLVSELRLRAVATRAAANAFLPAFLADFNRRMFLVGAFRFGLRDCDRLPSPRVRGDDRGSGRGAGAGSLQAAARAGAGDHLHRRAGCHRTRAGQVVIGGSSEQEQTLNQILTEMDGFSSREGIIVLAATNQPDALDKALLRPGRFDRRVVVDLPDKTGREAILKVHTRRVPLASDVSLGDLAATTPGFSGADLRDLVNEAALLAARRGENEVHHKDFLDSLTILGLVVPGADPVNRVTNRAAWAGPRRDLSAP